MRKKSQYQQRKPNCKNKCLINTLTYITSGKIFNPENCEYFLNINKIQEMIFDERLDVLVAELNICELKAVDEMNPVWKAQILT